MQTSSGARLSNIFYCHQPRRGSGVYWFGTVNGSAYLSVCVWGLLALVREPLEIESWNFTCGLTFLSGLWLTLQVIAHHIQDKLAVSFDPSSIGRTSYKWFLTIDAKYSSVKNLQRGDFKLLEKKKLFGIFKSIICIYILTLSPFHI